MTEVEDTTPTPTTEVTEPLALLARLFGTTLEEMREHPELAREKFAAVFGELAQTQSTDEAARGAAGVGPAKELLRRLRRELEASGEQVPLELEELPARLNELANRLGGATPEDLAELLRGLAASVETPGGGNATLDEVAAWFESNFGSLVGSARARQREDARMQARYRESAKRSIAASLREHGIQPLTTDPVAPRPAIKRHRLFWKEFAESAEDLRAQVFGGEIEEATKRVAELLDAFDLDLTFKLSREDDDAVLAFVPSDDVAAATALHVVVRDSPRLQGWRFIRGRRYGA